MSYVSQCSLIIYRPIIPVWLIDNRPIIPTILKVARQHKGSVCHCITKAGRGFVVSGQYPQVMMEELEELWILHCKTKQKKADEGGKDSEEEE